MSENLSYRTLVSLTDSEREKYQNLMKVKGIKTFSGLVRVALAQYSNATEVIANPQSDLDTAINAIEKRLSARLDEFHEQLSDITLAPHADSTPLDEQEKTVYLVIKSHVEGISTTQLVDALPFGNRYSMMKVCARLEKANKIVSENNLWRVA